MDYLPGPQLSTLGKLEFAYSIVNTAFYLLGTSWLLHLHSRSLHVSTCDERPYLALEYGT